METLKSEWTQGRKTFGVWCAMPCSISAELIARRGADYVCVDYQHGVVDHVIAVQMMQAITAGGSRPIARVPSNEPAAIGRVLDAGALAVVVPMVDDADEARRAVEACRYPPRGVRSYGPIRAREVLHSSDPTVLEDIVCAVMIETASGVENARAIIRTDGIDVVYIGPNDLSLAMGFEPGRFPHDTTFVNFLNIVVGECRAAGVCPGIQAPNGEVAAYYADLGFGMITVGTDAPMLGLTVEANLAAARAC